MRQKNKLFNFIQKKHIALFIILILVFLGSKWFLSTRLKPMILTQNSVKYVFSACYRSEGLLKCPFMISSLNQERTMLLFASNHRFQSKAYDDSNASVYATKIRVANCNSDTFCRIQLISNINADGMLYFSEISNSNIGRNSKLISQLEFVVTLSNCDGDYRCQNQTVIFRNIPIIDA